MSRPMMFQALAVLAGVATATGTARADNRSFAHTYEYTTMPAGKTALVLWHTQTRAKSEATSPPARIHDFYEGILQIEHGITEHWDIAFYTVVEQIAIAPTSDQPIFMSGQARLHTRYRLAERGELPVDTQLHLEVAKPFGASLYEVSGKLIGARDFGDLTLAVNALAELIAGKDVEETEVELGWAAGATYQVHPKLRVGVETWAMLEDGEPYMDAGPVLSWAPTSSFWTTVTAGFAITERDSVTGPSHGAFSVRALVGIEL